MSTLDERIKRMKERGIPMPITQMPISEGAASAIPVTEANQDKHARLAAIKSGANRQKIQTLIKSKSVQSGFQGIPEPKMKKNPNHQGNKLSDKSMAIKPQENFGAKAPISSEFSAMEAMYGGGSDVTTYAAPQQPLLNGTSQPELQIQQDGYGPTFDPVAMLNKKRAIEAQNNQPKQEYDYMQHAVNPQAYQPQDGQQQFNFQYMQKMMQEIAKQTISEVLNKYVENKNKKTLTYENVKTKGGAKVIKTQDGKYYKLTPVTLTKG